MKIHFLIPSTADFGQQEVLDRIFGCNYGFFPQHNVFILSPATVLKKAGYDVEVTDCVVEKISLRDALAKGGDVFVFYSVFLSREVDLRVAREIKKRRGFKWIIFLGNDPLWFLEKYLIDDSHIVIRGEPEITILELLDQINRKRPDLSKVRGIVWRKNGRLIKNPSRKFIENLDFLPIPDRTLLKKPFDYPNARFSQFPSTTMLTSRGCSYRCRFCLPNSLSFARELDWKESHCQRKPPVRVRSAREVSKEFKQIAKDGFKSVSILDDQFLWDRKRTDSILKNIAGLNLEISILARCDRITDYQLAGNLFKAGIRHIAFGVESLNQTILDDIKKDLKISQIDQAIKWCQKAGIQPEINIMLGSSPLETKETIKKTLDKVEKLKVDIVHINIITPFPGTEFARLAKEKGWMTVPEYVPVDSSAQSLISYPHLTDIDLVKAIKKYIVRHYFSPKYIWRNLRKIKSVKELTGKIKAGINEFKLLLIK